MSKPVTALILAEASALADTIINQHLAGKRSPGLLSALAIALRKIICQEGQSEARQQADLVMVSLHFAELAALTLEERRGRDLTPRTVPPYFGG